MSIFFPREQHVSLLVLPRDFILILLKDHSIFYALVGKILDAKAFYLQDSGRALVVESPVSYIETFIKSPCFQPHLSLLFSIVLDFSEALDGRL